MIKHDIVYDVSICILVVIMPVYAIEAVCFYHFACGSGCQNSFVFFDPLKPNKYRSEGSKSGYGEYPCSLYVLLLGFLIYTNAGTNDQ